MNDITQTYSTTEGESRICNAPIPCQESSMTLAGKISVSRNNLFPLVILLYSYQPTIDIIRKDGFDTKKCLDGLESTSRMKNILENVCKDIYSLRIMEKENKK